MSNLISLIDALLDLDAKGALAPHGIGGHARTLFEKCKEELNTRPAAPVEGLETVGATYLGYFYSKSNRAVWPDKAKELVDRSQAEAIIAVLNADALIEALDRPTGGSNHGE